MRNKPLTRSCRSNLGLLGLALLLTFWCIAGPRVARGQAGLAGQAGERTTLAALAAPQEEPSGEAEPPSEGHAEAEEHSLLREILHWANFLILFGGIWYLVRKFLAPFLQERGRLIREDMERSAKVLVDADQRLSRVEEKLRSLDEEITSLRQAALQEAAAEQARIERATATDAGKILVAAEQEIEAAVKAARQELKAYTAELAVELAEKKISDSLTPQAEERILRSFFDELAGDSRSRGNGDGMSRRKEG